MTRTMMFVALTLACWATELRAQMTYPYISPPGLGSRGGRMGSYYSPTYIVPTYATAVPTGYVTPGVYITQTYITPAYGTSTSRTIIGTPSTIYYPTYTSPTVIYGPTTTTSYYRRVRIR